MALITSDFVCRRCVAGRYMVALTLAAGLQVVATRVRVALEEFDEAHYTTLWCAPLLSAVQNRAGHERAWFCLWPCHMSRLYVLAGATSLFFVCHNHALLVAVKGL